MRRRSRAATVYGPSSASSEQERRDRAGEGVDLRYASEPCQENSFAIIIKTLDLIVTRSYHLDVGGDQAPAKPNNEDDMSTYRNTDERFGFSDPFEAESREAMADEMQPSFETWADEAEARYYESGTHQTAFDRDAWIANCREEFIDALEEVVSAPAKTLSALVSEIHGCSLIHTDRGNGCGGPGYEDATDVYHEIEREERADEELTEADCYDVEAWELARDAYRALGLNPGGISAVYLGERADGDNARQMIYVV